MTDKTFRFSVAQPVPAGGTVIDQMVARMTAIQLANGGRAVYSFELAEPEWRFLGENHPGTERALFKPADAREINDRVGPWGGREPITDLGTGHRAYEGGACTGNTQTLKGAGGSQRSFWDARTDQAWHIAGSTGYHDSKLNLVKYDARLDEFRHWTSGGVDSQSPDSEASLYPGLGTAHNFGMSAWDQERQRLYMMLRTSPTGLSSYWPVWMDLGQEREYATREQWLAGRGSWFHRSPPAEAITYSNAWAQTVFAPHIGERGSLIILQRDNQTLDRWDCVTRQLSRYARLPRMLTPRAGNGIYGPLSYRGPTMILVDEHLYLASFEDREFWRIHLPANGGAYTLERNLLAKCPVPMDLSGYQYNGSHTLLMQFPGERAFYALVIDASDYSDGSFRPTGGLYRYDIEANEWSEKLAPFYMQGLLDAGVRIKQPPHNGTATEIPRLGVFFIAFQVGQYENRAFLLKPPL